MKKSFVFLLLLGAIPLTGLAWQGKVVVETPHTQMILHADEGKDLRMDYYGERVATLQELRDAGDAFDFPALPAYGTVDMIHLPALQVQHADGDLNLELCVTDVERQDAPRFTLHVITMADHLQPVTVKVFYKAYREVDVIETWTTIEHREKQSIVLKRFDSGHLVVRRGNVWITHLHGDWAAEAHVTQEPLSPGLQVIRNTDGARNAHCDAPELMLSLDGKPAEETGRTIGAALCWSGNYELRVNTSNKSEHHLYAGIDPQSSEYVLEPKEVFETPHLALSFSVEGMGGVSRAFHRWARTEGMLHRGMGVGDILLNSWEGLYFDIDESRMKEMMADIADLGGELFVMDDGWFGSKYQRNDDSAALGDWIVDARKLPDGLQALTDEARGRGIKFGIWVEPEAVNTKSELFERHPEWALQVKGRELKLGRGGTQLVLDMTNPEVQDFAFLIIDNLLSQNPEISYIKWDANASIQNYGSPYLRGKDGKNSRQSKQSNLYIDYHKGLLKVLQRIREKYPDVVIQDCASGGGRANYALLPYFDEFWVSDDTDALQRIYMQWGTSYFFPAIAMASHISATPNHQTFRTTAFKFRCDVAMSGRLGMEIQPKNMTDEEKKIGKQAIADYKRIRPVVQFGDLYRLHSPYAGDNLASLMYVSEDKAKAVFYWYKLETFVNQHFPRIKMAGLDPQKRYTVHELNRIDNNPLPVEGKTFTGEYLMANGIEIPYSHDVDYHKKNDWASRVIYLEAE